MISQIPSPSPGFKIRGIISASRRPAHPRTGIKVMTRTMTHLRFTLLGIRNMLTYDARPRRRRTTSPYQSHLRLTLNRFKGHPSSSLPHTPLALGRGSSVPPRGCRLFYGIINTPKIEHSTTRPSSIFLSLDDDFRSGEFVCVAISWARVRRVSEERLAN